MAKINKLCSNLDQSNPATGGFTDEEKQTMRNNIGAGTANVHIILTDYSSPTMGDTSFTELVNAVNSKEEVIIVVGQASSAIYYKLATVTQSAYRFEAYTANGLSSLTIDTNTKAKTFNTAIVGLPSITHYDASFGNSYKSMQELTDAISSGVTLITVTLSTPITLQANKRYMIIPNGITGNVEQTKTVAHTLNNTYSLDMWLYDSNVSRINGKSGVILASAEICNYHNAILGEYPPVGGTYQGSYNSSSSIIEPEVNLTLDTISIINGGNIGWGFNRNNPALLVFVNRIAGISVMEIQ